MASECPDAAPIDAHPDATASTDRVDRATRPRQLVADAVAEKIDAEGGQARPTSSTAKARAARSSTSTAWPHTSTRSTCGPGTSPAGRKPRFTRDDIAEAAMRIADAEGFDALSMRRLAAELDAGTMTLYHYVRTKDELLTLVTDAVMGEVVVPGRRAAARRLARRDHHRSPTAPGDALLRHPWMLDIADDPPIGPNSVRHFDQSHAGGRLAADLARRAARHRSSRSTSTCSASACTSATTSAATTTRTTEILDYVGRPDRDRRLPAASAHGRRPRPRVGLGPDGDGDERPRTVRSNLGQPARRLRARVRPRRLKPAPGVTSAWSYQRLGLPAPGVTSAWGYQR